MKVTTCCRVCGKEYTPCKSAKYDPKVFNWKEVACSAECGSIYLQRVLASRAPAPAEKPKRVASRKKPVVEDSIEVVLSESAE